MPLNTAYQLLKTPEEIKKLSRYYTRTKGVIYLDTETTGVNYRQDRMVLLQMKLNDTKTILIDLRSLPGKFLRETLAPFFVNHLFVGHNIKFDYSFLARRGLVMSQVWDTQVGEQVRWGLGLSDARIQGKPMTLAELTKRYHDGLVMSKEERNWFIDLDQRPEEWAAGIPEEQLAYSALDVEVLPRIYAEQTAQLEALGLTTVAALEMRALPAIASMELAGIHIDTEGWAEFIRTKTIQTRQLENVLLQQIGPTILARRWEAYDAQQELYEGYKAEEAAEVIQLGLSKPQGTSWGIWKHAGLAEWRKQHEYVGRPRIVTELVNVNSPVAVLDALQAMGVPTISTSSIILEELRGEYAVVDALLDYRKCVKFIQSFGQSLLDRVEDDQRIHPTYVQIGASTGRMSCTNPNWQQVPSKGDGQKLRELVQAAEGNQLITADFSNIELRILADLSKDATMLRLFAEGKDLHAATACMMYNLPENTDIAQLKDKSRGPIEGWAYRDVAKTINFGLVYGMSAMKLSRTLRTTKEEATSLMQKYFTIYSGVKTWLDTVGQTGLRTMVSKTMAGRKRFYSMPSQPVPPQNGTQEEWDAYREQQRDYRILASRIERQAKNTPIQGTSADITKLALALWHEDTAKSSTARLVACVHDEIVVECKSEDTLWHQQILEECMFNAATHYLKRVVVPPTVASVGTSWQH